MPPTRRTSAALAGLLAAAVALAVPQPAAAATPEQLLHPDLVRPVSEVLATKAPLEQIFSSVTADALEVQEPNGSYEFAAGTPDAARPYKQIGLIAMLAYWADVRGEIDPRLIDSMRRGVDFYLQNRIYRTDPVDTRYLQVRNSGEAYSRYTHDGAEKAISDWPSTVWALLGTTLTLQHSERILDEARADALLDVAMSNWRWLTAVSVFDPQRTQNQGLGAVAGGLELAALLTADGRQAEGSALRADAMRVYTELVRPKRITDRGYAVFQEHDEDYDQNYGLLSLSFTAQAHWASGEQIFLDDGAEFARYIDMRLSEDGFDYGGPRYDESHSATEGAAGLNLFDDVIKADLGRYLGALRRPLSEPPIAFGHHSWSPVLAHKHHNAWFGEPAVEQDIHQLRRGDASVTFTAQMQPYLVSTGGTAMLQSIVDRSAAIGPYYRAGGKHVTLTAVGEPRANRAGLGQLDVTLVEQQLERPAATRPLEIAGGNVGTSADVDVFTADFDGGGYSYSAEALASVGVTPGAAIPVNGITYTWPQSPAGTQNNLEARGQVIALRDVAAGADRLGFLGAAHGGPSEGRVTVNYVDGTSATHPLGMSDWTLRNDTVDPAFGNVIAVDSPYHNSRRKGGRHNHEAYAFVAEVPLDPAKQLVSVTLPNRPYRPGGDVHIFDIATVADGSLLAPYYAATVDDSDRTVDVASAYVNDGGSVTAVATLDPADLPGAEAIGLHAGMPYLQQVTANGSAVRAKVLRATGAGGGRLDLGVAGQELRDPEIRMGGSAATGNAELALRTPAISAGADPNRYFNSPTTIDKLLDQATPTDSRWPAAFAGTTTLDLEQQTTRSSAESSLRHVLALRYGVEGAPVTAPAPGEAVVNPVVETPTAKIITFTAPGVAAGYEGTSGAVVVEDRRSGDVLVAGRASASGPVLVTLPDGLQVTVQPGAQAVIGAPDRAQFRALRITGTAGQVSVGHPRAARVLVHTAVDGRPGGIAAQGAQAATFEADPGDTFLVQVVGVR